MKKILFTLSSVSLIVAGGSVALAGKNEKKPVAAFKEIGEPKNCISLRSIRSTKVVDAQTIDFRMTGRKTYRNKLGKKCPGLKFEERFSYRTSQSQLCNVDIIHVLHSTGGSLQEGAACGLGKFQQIEKIKNESVN